MKILFLDFDGVLNTDSYRRKLLENGKMISDNFGPLFDPAATDNLKKIVDAVPGLVIMITSSWKVTHDFSWFKELWSQRNMPGQIRLLPDYVPEIDFSQVNEEDIYLLSGKGYEIKHWLEMSAPDNCKFAILDDMSIFLPEQLPYLVQTDPLYGITEKEVRKVVELLTKD